MPQLFYYSILFWYTFHWVELVRVRWRTTRVCDMFTWNYEWRISHMHSSNTLIHWMKKGMKLTRKKILTENKTVSCFHKLIDRRAEYEFEWKMETTHAQIVFILNINMRHANTALMAGTLCRASVRVHVHSTERVQYMYIQWDHIGQIFHWILFSSVNSQWW